MTAHTPCKVSAQVDAIHAIASGKKHPRWMTLEEAKKLAGDQPQVIGFHLRHPHEMVHALMGIFGERR